MSAPELKPCPFCGKDSAVLFERVDEFRARCAVFSVHCRSCIITTRRYDIADMAVAAWNRRAGEEAK